MANNDKFKLFDRVVVHVGERQSDEEDSFSVLQFNTLARCNATTKAFPKVPAIYLDWKYRYQLLFNEIFLREPDFACLQEVDERFKGQLEDACLMSRESPWAGLDNSYSCVYIPKKDKREGIMIIHKRKYEIVECSALHHADIDGVKQNQVSVLCVFSFLSKRGHTKLKSIVSLVVAHLKSKAEFATTRLSQGKDILEKIENWMFSNPHPLIIAGDFNAEPDEDVMEEFTKAGFKSSYCIGGHNHPDFTSFKYKEDREQLRTIDYILHNEYARPVQILEIPTRNRLQGHDGRFTEHVGLPSYTYPSDHVALFTRFAVKKPAPENIASSS